ncbi:hypothetical protein [Paraliomyxa miuraensis]|uniref:hypothetical protein n=1 Tax=Paraliomyxa miuraensis TaxID=376150 RepID=UPI00224D4C7B|nr:hypothetical protein [Paraliomyxa miuraensis]MCX4240899.1 hypothetical protein [Paraliomyxa miuraensis]
MHRSSRSIALSALLLGLAPVGACKRSQTSSDTSPGATTTSDGDHAEEPKRARRKPGLPRPLRLPDDAPIVIHVEAPGDALAGLSAYDPQLPDGRGLLLQAVQRLPGAGELEQTLAGAIDLDRPFDVASVEGQLIVQVPVVPARVDSIAALLADKPAVGRFGAVDLQRTAGPGPKLAWLDRETSTLTLADDERGLATGRHLARAYGKQPLRVQLQGAEARKYAPQLVLEQLELRGAGPHDFELEAKGVPDEAFEPLAALQPGALTGLLESPRIAVGASSKYAHYDRDVKQILAEAKRNVDRQNFLIKGTLEDLLRRFGSVLRSWNGRTMVGVADDHVLLGLGTDDTKKMGGALFHLITGLIDNLDLARSIGISVPRIRFQRNKTAAAGSNISVIALEDARKYVPREAASLVDGRGDLRIAVAFPSRAGAGMVAIGPECHDVLGKWLEDVAAATPAKDSENDFIAATVAVDPAAVEPLLQGGDPAAILGLSAAREPTQIEIERDGDAVKVRVRGPEPVRRPKRLGTAGRPGAQAAGRAPAGDAGAGRPARAQPSGAATKPIQ